MRISDWSSDVCSSDLPGLAIRVRRAFLNPGDQRPSSGLKPLRVHRSITGILAPFGIAEHEGFPDPQPLRVRPELFYIRESGPERFGHGIDGPRAALIKTDRPEGCFPAPIGQRSGRKWQQLFEIGRASCRERVCKTG